MTGQAKFFAKKHLAAALLLTFAALGFRLFIALRLPTDEPDDGRLYARIANNVLDHGSFSIATEEPFEPTYIRLPGYPLFLAAVYKLFGRDNNTAVRVIQGVVDTLTCWLVAWLALVWTPARWEPERRRRALLMALGLAASCPFLAIYTATLLTEVWTAFFATLCALAASQGLRRAKKQIAWWALAGLAGVGATSFRPDGGLFVAAVGGTLALVGAWRVVRQWRDAKKSNESDKALEARRGARQVIAETLLHGALLTLGFGVALAPWTIRNARRFGVFMPIAPAQANMPDEFVPRGFILWLKTWVDDVKYTQTVEWAMDLRAIHIEQVPAEAFDSPDERDRIAALLERYNNEPPPPLAPSARPEIEDENAAAPVANAPPLPGNNNAASRTEQSANGNTANQAGASPPSETPGSLESINKNRAPLSGRAASKSAMVRGLANRRAAAGSSTNKNAENSNVANNTKPPDDGDTADDSSDDDQSPSDDASGDDDSSSDDDQEEAAEPPKFTGEMTPDIDAGFMEIARDRIGRHPFRFYLIMPLRRAASLWFDTHSQYYPFQGELLPLKNLDHEQRQHIWLPLFAALTWVYTLLAALGAWVMWRGGDSRAWLLMLALLMLPRLAFLATLENPEPRYVVELFTFIMAAASLALAGPVWSGAAKLFRKPSSDSPAN